MNRVSLLKYLFKSSSTTCLGSTYATFSNKKFLNENKSVTVKGNQFNGFESEFLQFIKTTKDLTSIHKFKKDVILKYKTVLLTHTSFDAVFMRMCIACRNYSLGKQFLDHINQSDRQVNTATLARYLELCYHCKEEIMDKSEVERLCHVVKSNSLYPSPSIQQSLILGFSITDNWREGYKLLSESEGTSTSLSMNAIIDCLFKNDQIDTAVSWINKIIISKGKKVHDFTYEHWLRKCADQQIGCNSFFDFLVKSGVFLNTSIIQQFKDLLENRLIDPFVGHFTTIDEGTGRCRSCEKVLQNSEISDDEFANLKKGLMEKVLLGTDVYLGSKPDEIRRFQNFIQKTAPYDVVIDGLNVAHQGKQTFKYPDQAVSYAILVLPCRKITNPQSFYFTQLSSVVNYFTNQNLRVLVLTRKHLLRGTTLKSALVFATENLYVFPIKFIDKN
jgi:ribonuclease P protein 3